MIVWMPVSLSCAAQKTTDGVIATYVYDYANRLIALGSRGATTTYGYNAFGSRVFQSTATTTSP